MYEVIKAFHDLQDRVEVKGGIIFHEYRVGDEFPRKGRSVSQDRLDELASDENAQGTPLIREVYNGKAIDLTKASKGELLDFAAENGIEVDKKATKQEILDTIMTSPAE